MTREEDDMEQKASTAKKEEKIKTNLLKCVFTVPFFAREGNGNDYL